MEVYIKDMKMPKRCSACKMGFCQQIGCDLYIGFDGYHKRRHPDCPLIEVPEPHGDLIDRNRLLRPEPLQFAYHLANGDTAIPIIDIKHAPTVIPASEVHDD